MDCMEENPYRSPEPVPQVEKRPTKPPNRYLNAGLNGLLSFVGLGILLAGILGVFLSPNVRLISRSSFPLSVMAIAVIAGPAGAAVAWWTWRAPESKWPAVTAILSGSSPLALFVLVVLYEFVWPVPN